MTSTQKTPMRKSKAIVKALSLLALVLVMATAVNSPAHAYGPRGRDWDHHSRESYRYHHAHPHYAPGYVEAPPVVYSPPPEPSPGINLILPLHFH